MFSKFPKRFFTDLTSIKLLSLPTRHSMLYGSPPFTLFAPLFLWFYCETVFFCFSFWRLGFGRSVREAWFVLEFELWRCDVKEGATLNPLQSFDCITRPDRLTTGRSVRKKYLDKAAQKIVVNVIFKLILNFLFCIFVKIIWFLRRLLLISYL